MKKILSIICGVGGIVTGLTIIVFSIMEKEFSTPLWIAFSFFCFANAAINFSNIKRKK